MLFNSHAFLFAFLPLAFTAFFGLGRLKGGRVAIPAVVVSSLAFYAYWDWRNLGLIVPSLLVNFAIGHALTDASAAGAKKRGLLIVGIVFNLALLGTFKYADFAIGTYNFVGGFVGAPAGTLLHIALPLGISFFTFEQIAYIVDASRGGARRYGFGEYCFFVTFYPHLIAGPIIQHDDLLGQVEGERSRTLWKPNAENIALGASILVIGLFKKVVIADACAPFAGSYDHIHDVSLTTVEAWVATVGYSLQLYFDFSGYSDMAIGLARMMNIKLPQNFNSPYQAHNPIEFWRRWHMTLSRFLRVYLYIPLGGNRGSQLRRYVNLLLTMLLGGLWHGAGWGFVIWGGLNGVYLVINNLFRAWRGAPKDNEPDGPWWRIELSCLVTFFFIMLSRVFFRSPDFSAATTMLGSLFGAHGAGFQHLAHFRFTIFAFIALYLFCRHAPNTQQVLAHARPVLGKVEHPSRVQIPLSLTFGVVLAGMALWALLLLTRVSEFLYFQF